MPSLASFIPVIIMGGLLVGTATSGYFILVRYMWKTGHWFDPGSDSFEEIELDTIQFREGMDFPGKQDKYVINIRS